MKKYLFFLIFAAVLLIFFVLGASYASYLDLKSGLFTHWTVYFFALYFAVFDIAVVILLLKCLFITDARKKYQILEKIGKGMCVTVFILMCYGLLAPKKFVTDGDHEYTYYPCLARLVPVSANSMAYQMASSMIKGPDYCPF